MTMQPKLTEIMEAVSRELDYARTHFPSNRHMLHAFTEEAGEVTKAFLDLEQRKSTPAMVTKEIVQAIAMACRLLQEGDPSFNYKCGVLP